MRRVVHALASLHAVLRNRELRRVELAWGAVVAAEWAHFVALGVFAYDAGGAAAVGVAGLVRMLPAALIAPFAASLGDRFRRERFMLVVTLAGALALAGTAVAFFAGENVYVVVGLAGMVGLASTLFRPALQAILPSLARTPEELIASNGATSTIESLGTLTGPLLAGVVVASANEGVVFAAAATTFGVAAALLSTLRVEGRLRPAGASEESAGDMLLAGFRVVARTPKPRLVVGLVMAQGFVRGCLNVLIVVAVFRVLDADEGAVGYLTAALGVGGLVGAFGALTLQGRRLAVPFGLALVFWGLPIALVSTTPNLATALVLLAVVGAANSVENVAAFTLLQRIVPDALLTRTFAVLWGLAMGAVAIGSVAAPALVSAIGPKPAFVTVGALLPVLTMLTWRRLVEIDRTALPPAEELVLLERVAMFSPLSVAAKEHMASALLPVEVGAGETVIRAGDRGDRFYIVAEGELEVVAEGLRATAGEGDSFGEIALLRDVPRTATVTAIAPSRLYALEREDFLAAVAGHSGVRAAGEAVASERLAAGAPATGER